MRSRNASRPEGERSSGKSDYNIHMQAERLLSDDTSAHFKPRHDGGKARRGVAGGIVLHYCPCSTRPFAPHKGQRSDEAREEETNTSVLSKHTENRHRDSQGFDLSGGRNTC